MRMHPALISIIVLSLFLNFCDSTEFHKERIAAVEDEYGEKSYEAGLVYVDYIMKYGDDLELSLDLVDKLIKNLAFSEARYSLLKLQEEFTDYRLHYLNAVCLRNLYRFDEAEKALGKAMELNDVPVLDIEHENILEEKQEWRELNRINELIKEEGLHPELRLERAGHLIYSGYFEAGLLDVDSTLDNVDVRNEAYRLKTRAYILMKNYQKADSVLMKWKDYAPEILSEEINTYSVALENIIQLKPKVNSGRTNPADFINLARNLKDILEFAEAERILDRGLNRFPDNLNLHYASLLIYVESNQLEKARKTADNLEERGVDIPAELKRVFQ